LQLFGSQPVDAILLEYHLGPQDASVIASEIKQLRPDVPIVMLAEPEELPASSRNVVDVLVSKSAPPHFVWAAVHFALSMKPCVNFRTRSRGTRGAESASKSRKSSRRPKTSSNRSAGCHEQIA
jgi:DNA-binding NarL/FixJ family response regulator